MTALLSLSLIAVAAALARGGSLASWTTVRVRWAALALGSLAIQLVLHNPPVDHQPWAIAIGPLLWVGCVVVLFAALLRNAWSAPSLRGPWLVAAVGVGLNLLVVVGNGGFMPQSADARLATRGTVIQTAEPKLRNVVPLSESTPLAFLGDVIGEPDWFPNANVISLGDVVLGLGLAWYAWRVSARRRVAV